MSYYTREQVFAVADALEDCAGFSLNHNIWEASVMVRLLQAETERLRSLLLEAADDIADWGAEGVYSARQQDELDKCVEKYRLAAM